MKMSDRTYLYTIAEDDTIEWYAGLGSPYKISGFNGDKRSMPKSQIQSIKESLETFTGKVWHEINGQMLEQIYDVCQCCGLTWTDACVAFASSAEVPLKATPITSVFRDKLIFKQPDVKLLISKAIVNRSRCKECNAVFCGKKGCALAKAGKRSRLCDDCYKPSWKR
jgi:hypothetical protein